MLTPFGKAIRKHRIDAGMLLKEMADRLGVSSAFLSSIETGRKPIPRPMIEKISKLLNLDMVQRGELEKAVYLSGKDFTLSVGPKASANDRVVAAMLARQFPSLTDEDKDDIRKILEKRNA